jgi:putative ABC transport system permease protein
MIKNYLKIAWRKLWKNKFYSFINIVGLALSISCSILLFLFITYHLSFDTYHAHAKQIYRIVLHVTFEDGLLLYDQGAPLALARDIGTGNSQVKETSVLLRMHDINVTIPQNNGAGKKMFTEHENIAITDKHFLICLITSGSKVAKAQPLLSPIVLF